VHWFTSDTHFGHANIIRHCGRPFQDVREMDEELIRHWNATVRDGDAVWHLGDFAYRCHKRHALGIFRRLRGEVHLVPGGHDHKLARLALPPGAVEPPLTELRAGGLTLVLCHYPLLTWRGTRRGAWMVHGHAHGGGPEPSHPRRVNVASDLTGFRPVSLDELREMPVRKYGR
jgi:calcineurin-like phosphoesterase family protein